MTHREFLQHTAVIASTVALAPSLLAAEKTFPVVRVTAARRKFTRATWPVNAPEIRASDRVPSRP